MEQEDRGDEIHTSFRTSANKLGLQFNDRHFTIFSTFSYFKIPSASSEVSCTSIQLVYWMILINLCLQGLCMSLFGIILSEGFDKALLMVLIWERFNTPSYEMTSVFLKLTRTFEFHFNIMIYPQRQSMFRFAFSF